MIFTTRLAMGKAARSIGLAILIVSVALLVRMAAGYWLGASVPFLTFFPAVLVSAMLGGWIAGASAVVLTLVAGAVYFRTMMIETPPSVAVVFYLAGCAISILAAEKLRNAHERCRKAEHKLATALAVSGVGTWRWNVACDRVEWDERLCRIFGKMPDEAPKHAADFLKLVLEEDRPRMMLSIEASLKNPHAAEYVYRIKHPQLGIRWVADRNDVLFGANGKPAEIVGASIDVTERKQADEHRELLIRELHHRVRNTLAMVQGMANATANTAQDLAHFKETFARRIASLAMTHALLTDEKTQSTTLSRLVRQEMEALGMPERLELTGADLMLPSDLAVPIGMALHELATNAVKHGALSTAQGRIQINCSLDDESGDISWSEIDGPTVIPPERRGFGAQLLDRVIQVQLGAKTSRDFAPDGLRVVISIPREKLTANANDRPSTFHAQAS
ncbi:MAG: signal transduction histidine kinase [Hyphomicrobiales bacterium]|nr:signal transduction histidine kinase [Hyphomicrobiales bacterium]